MVTPVTTMIIYRHAGHQYFNLLPFSTLKPILSKHIMHSSSQLPVSKHYLSKLLLNKSEFNYEFNLLVYSSYSYEKRYSSLFKLKIGHFSKHPNLPLIAVFLTPLLHQNEFLATKLTPPPIKCLFSQRTTQLDSIHHIPEGNRIKQRAKHKSEEILNQEKCICAHNMTQRIFLESNHKMFKPLAYGKKQHKYLYEHLG